MSNTFSVASSMGGLMSLSDIVISRLYKYIKEAKGADKHVAQLLSETSTMHSLFSQLAAELEARSDVDDDAKYDPAILQCLYPCTTTLRKLNQGLQAFGPQQQASTELQSSQASIKTLVAGDNDPETSVGSDAKLGFVRRSVNRLAWPFSKDATMELISQMERHKSTLLVAVSTGHWRDTRKVLASQEQLSGMLSDIKQDTSKALAVSQAQESSAKVQRMFEWISSYDPSQNYHAAREEHQEGSGEWIFEVEEYEKWIASDNAGLWLEGIPGAGKTILSSVIIDRLFNTIGPGFAYYYCDYKSPTSQDPLNVLGSLVKQLVRQNTECLVDLEKCYRDHHPDGWPTKGLRTENLALLIQRIARRFRNITLVIDGLDECGAAPGIDRSGLVAALSSLHSVKSAKIRTLVSSRKEGDIAKALSNFDVVTIAAQSADLQLYVAAEVARRSGKLRFRSVELRDRIIQTLIDKSQGMFQWCKCQLDYLSTLPNDKARAEALNDLPPDLPATYVRILERIDREYAPQTTTLIKRCLKWLVLQRDGYGDACILSLPALGHAISALGQTTLDADIIPHEDDLVDWCSSLVRTNKKTAALELSHFTVKEFLLEAPEKISSTISRTYLVDPATDNLFLAESCLQYVSLKDFEESRMVSHMSSFSQFRSKYPFYCHAAVHLPDYLNLIPVDKSDLPSFTHFFSPDSPQPFLFWSRFVATYSITAGDEEEAMYKWYTKEQGLTMIQAASAFLLVDTTERLLKTGLDPDDGRDRVASALHLCIGGPISTAELHYGMFQSPYRGAAAEELAKSRDPSYENRRESLVKVLLEHGADPNAMSIWTYRLSKRTSRPLTPLAASFFHLRPEISKLLLKSSASCVPTEESMGESFELLDLVLVEAEDESPYIRLNSIMDILLSLESTKSHVWKDFFTQEAASGASDDDEVDQEEKRQEALNTALIVASKVGNIGALDAALKAGANYESEDDGQSALFLAVEQGHEAVIARLVSCGADPNRADNDGDTAFLWAFRKKGASVAAQYFSSVRSPNISEEESLLALGRACKSKNMELMRFMIERGLRIPDEIAPLNLDEENPITDAEIFEVADKYKFLSLEDIKISFQAAVATGRAELLELIVSTKGADAIKQYGPVSELDVMSLPSYYVLIENDFFDDASITELLEVARDQLMEELEILLILKSSKKLEQIEDDDGNFALHRACLLDKTSLAEKLLAKGADVNARNFLNQTPLHLAPKHGTLPILTLLISKGADVNARDDSSRCPLHNYLARSILYDSDECGALLEAGADPNAQTDEQKLTPLHLAAREGHGVVIKTLLEYGANANIVDAEGVSPVRRAILSGRTSVIKLFLEVLGREYVLKSKDNQGRYALHDGAVSGSLDILRMLLKAGAAADQEDDAGVTPLHICVVTNTPYMANKIEVLLQAGANIDKAERHGQTALHWAALQGNKSTGVLLQHGASISVKDATGHTALLFAAISGDRHVVHDLLVRGADVEDSNNEGSTALHLSAANGHVATLRLLLTSGAAVNALDNSGRTPLDMCVYRQPPSVLGRRLLERYGGKTGAELKMASTTNSEAKQQDQIVINSDSKKKSQSIAPPAWFFSVNTWNAWSFKHYQAQGVDMTGRNWNGETALHIAARSGEVEFAQYLLEQSLDAFEADLSGTLPLHLAASLGAFKILALLIGVDHGDKMKTALCKASSIYGTPLAAAAAVDDLNVLELILDAGADPNAGYHPWLGPPLFVACALNRANNVKMLLSRGAKLAAEESTGFKTAMEVAIACRRPNMVSLLEEHEKGATSEP